ncbi:putative F-box/LRR-repeat protein [Trifolium repens]|nr:putative F-box/LRR-repeat protein [Trifolium repens]
MKRCKILNSELTDYVSELDDCVLSYILSKLTLKDLVKTRALSKHWLHKWGLRMDLNFDLHNMFGYNTVQELQRNFPCIQSEFARRLDQFMQHYQGAVIHSIRVYFPFSDKHRGVIGKLISKGIAKGVKRIELLLSNETTDTDFDIEMNPLKFSFTLLSDTDSLTYLHLQNCLIAAPMDFSGLKNLRTLVLHAVPVKPDLLSGLFSNCIHLADFTLDDCDFISDLQIISSTLFHLNIVNCRVYMPCNIDIIASNLSSFEYSCNGPQVHPLNIKAHMLSKFSYRGSQISKFVRFSGLRNVTTIVLDGLRECLQKRAVPCLFKKCLQLDNVTFKNCRIKREMKIISAKLRHLKIIDCGYKDVPPCKIDIDALNLSSFEYIGHRTMIFSVTAPNLLKVFCNAAVRRKNQHSLSPIPRLHHVENLVMLTSHSQIAKLKKDLGQFQNLRQLELFIDEAHDPNMGYYSILDVLMASQRLEKLSLTVRNSPVLGQKREYAGFFHNDLKYVELHGCVCTINAIEFAKHLLRNAISLKKITFDSVDKFYIGAGRWSQGSNDHFFNRNFIHKRLKDEVKGQCQLKIL